MSINEVYESELWEKLLNNRAFSSKFFEAVKVAQYYVGEDGIGFEIKDDTLIVSYCSPVLEREYNCQCTNARKYEMSIDKDGNLVVNEIFGTIHSNYGYNFLETEGGILETQYSCGLYDPDGVQLSYLGYTDTYTLEAYKFKKCKKEFPGNLEIDYTPSLVYYNDYTEYVPRPGERGSLSKYIRRTRLKDELAIVDNIECTYNDDGTAVAKHELYLNTFLNHKDTLQPESINIVEGDPFAVVDNYGNIHINTRYLAQGYTIENYKEKAKEKFLNELKSDKEHLLMEDVEAKYDLMISRLEGELKTQKKN